MVIVYTRYTLILKNIQFVINLREMVIFSNAKIWHGFQIVTNGFYIVGGLTANRFSYSRCIQYKGNIKCRLLSLFRVNSFHNDAINSQGVTGEKKIRRSVTQRRIENECKYTFFF